MTDLSHEFRFKVSDDMHRMASALCAATGEDIATKGRELFQRWIDSELHAHMLRSRLLRGEGFDAESKGSRQA